MLASTMQFTKNNRTTTPTHPTTRQSARHVAPNSPRKPTPKEARFLRTQQCAQPTQAPDTGGSTPRTPPPAQGEARLRPLNQEEPAIPPPPRGNPLSNVDAGSTDRAATQAG